jgi:hypothetical protein
VRRFFGSGVGGGEAVSRVGGIVETVATLASRRGRTFPCGAGCNRLL